ncbi:MAG: hypothetical protein PHU93_00020 [Candidatus Gracilibacteria bacterium]|nr:hypothetical protein [Candidatus Gracilibacteria bacterium]
MDKKAIILKYYHSILELKDDLDKEMEGFIIESISSVNIILEHLKCMADYNDLIKNKIIIGPNNFNYNKIFTQEVINKIYRIRNEDNFKEIEKKLSEIYLDIVKYINENKFESLFGLLGDCILGITKKEVQDYQLNNTELKYHELSDKILREQEYKNKTPNITKENFFEKYPEFFESIDKDGLVNISNLEINWNKDGVYYKNYFLYYDDLFVELGVRNSFIYEFLPFFDKYKNNLEFKIKLNLDKIISISNYKELNLIGGMYFGPQFSIDKFFTKSNKTLFTRKQRLNPKFSNYFGNNLIYTDFYIDQINNSFLIEEIGENKNNGFYLNRLVHSEFEINNEKIKHFDGSVLFYNFDNLNKRKGVLLSTIPKLSDSKYKLFRIDGLLDFEDYKNILFSFYDRNEMILEYFNLDEYKRKYKAILDYENGTDY